MTGSVVLSFSSLLAFAAQGLQQVPQPPDPEILMNGKAGDHPQLVPPAQMPLRLNSVHVPPVSLWGSRRADLGVQHPGNALQPPDREVLMNAKPDAKPQLMSPPPRPRILKSSPAAPKISLYGDRRAEMELQPREVGLASEQPRLMFQPSEKFRAGMATLQGQAKSRLGASDKLPVGITSPVRDYASPLFKTPEYPYVDMPKEWEYSLEAGDSIKSYSSSQQDVKLLTQVLANISNGFYLDTNAWEGEVDSNTLLLELVGWRGLCLEPRVSEYIQLWSKFRKAYLFLGGISPTNQSGNTYVGFDQHGDVDQLSGHQVPTYPLSEYLAEMGGRETIDFWALRNGGYEAEVLNATLGAASSFKRPEIGVIMTRIEERIAGRGHQHWAEHQSRNDAEERIFTILVKEAGFKYIGGLDPKWINTVVPRWDFQDWVFVNPAYFERRNIPTPTAIKSDPPPPLPDGSQWDGFSTWNSGLSKEGEIGAVRDYIKRSKDIARPAEVVQAKAHRVEELKLMGSK